MDRMRTRCSRGALTDAIVPPSHGPDIDEDEVRRGAVLIRIFGSDLEDVIQVVDRKVNGDIAGAMRGQTGACDIGGVEREPVAESAAAGGHHAAGGDGDGCRGGCDLREVHAAAQVYTPGG